MLLLLPNTVSAQPARNPAGLALTVETSPPPSPGAKRLTISFNMFGNTVTVADITAEQSDQLELAWEHAECRVNLDPLACTNLILSAAQMRTGGVLSELIRLTKVSGNALVCIGTAFAEKPACVSLTQEALREIIFGPPPISPETPVPVQPQPPVPPIQPPAPTTIPGIDPFVGTWWIAQGAITLTIQADGTATYKASGVNSQLQFTSVQGNTAYGTVVSGTNIPAGPQGNPIPVGGNITVTLLDPHNLQVSNGFTLCPNTDQCFN